MSDLVTRAQLTLLARQLHVPEERIAYLERLGAEHLKDLREAMANRMFDDSAPMFRRISALVPVVPLTVAMPIAQKFCPPEMAGRAAGAIAVDHPKKAMKAITMVKPEFGAQAAPYIDPRAVGQIAHLAPTEPVVAITNEVLRRKDYFTGGLFVEFATPELIVAVEAGVDDDEGLIRSGAYAYSGKVISDIIRVIVKNSPNRIAKVITTVAEGPTDLRLSGLSTLARLDTDLIATVGEVLVDVTDEVVLEKLFRTFVAEGAAPELFKFVGYLTPATLDVLAANPAINDDALVESVVKSLASQPDDGMWRGLLEVAERTDVDLQRRVLDIVMESSVANDYPELPTRISRAATENHLWPLLLRMFANQDRKTRDKIVRRWVPLIPAEERPTVVKYVNELHLQDPLKGVLSAIS